MLRTARSDVSRTQSGLCHFMANPTLVKKKKKNLLFFTAMLQQCRNATIKYTTKDNGNEKPGLSQKNDLSPALLLHVAATRLAFSATVF